MAWAKVDDQLHAHPKTNRAFAACPASLGLHLMAMSYTSCFDLGGHVDEVFVAGKLPNAALRRKAIGALEDAGLWHRVQHGWEIHDWAVYNGDAGSREAARQAKAQAGRKGAAARWQKPDDEDGDAMADAMAGAIADASGSANGRAMAPSPSPNPSSSLRSDEERAGGRVVKFRGRTVAQATVLVAQHIVANFNRQAGTTYEPLTADGMASENLKRVLGAMRSWPAINAEVADRMIRRALAEPFWGDARPHLGHVFGPGVVEQNLQAATAGGASEPEDEFARQQRLREARERQDRESGARWATGEDGAA